jgi:hypothetical protein
VTDDEQERAKAPDGSSNPSTPQAPQATRLFPPVHESSAQVTVPPAQDGAPVPGSKTPDQLFEEARAKANAFLEKGGTPGKPQVDKYFGSKLPPVCRSLGCYVTDDGKFFYCINPSCHKDKKRETKYNRRKKSVVYFFCPKCKSREIQLHLKANNYECLDCAYTWKH